MCNIYICKVFHLERVTATVYLIVSQQSEENSKWSKEVIATKWENKRNGRKSLWKCDFPQIICPSKLLISF